MKSALNLLVFSVLVLGAAPALADTTKAKVTKKESSSAGSSAPALDAEGELAFKKHDLDGDGSISKAEAAGNAELMNAFDRADRNRDGKLSRAEYAKLREPKREAAR